MGMGATVTPSWPPPSTNPISNESNASILEPLPLNPYYHPHHHHHHHANPYHNSLYQTHSGSAGGHHGLMTGTPPPTSGGLIGDQNVSGQDSLFHQSAMHHAASLNSAALHGHHLNAAGHPHPHHHHHHHHPHPALNIGGLGHHHGHPLSMRTGGLSLDDLPHKGEDSEGKLQCFNLFKLPSHPISHPRIVTYLSWLSSFT